METMKFDEGNKDNNSDSNLNNEPAPKAPEGGVGDSGASETAEKAKNEAENQKMNEVSGASEASAGGDASIKTGEESSDDSKNIAAGGATMSFQTGGNDGKDGGNNRKKKLIAAGIALAVLILAVAGWQYWLYTQTPYYQQMKAVKMIEESLKESEKWGGKTPEETVSLFTEAVKKGDFELAAKYGDEEIKDKLEQFKNNGQIDAVLDGLSKGKLEENPGFSGGSFDLVVRENNEKYWVMSLFRSDNGIWKIVDF